MKTFPMFLQMAGRRVVIMGGGEQAAQKARLILKTEATVEIWAATFDAELSDLAASGRVTLQLFRHRAGLYRHWLPWCGHGAACFGQRGRGDC